jgi:hypothetical protein
MIDNAREQVAYFNNRCSYAKAMIGVTNRLDKAKAAAAAAAAVPAK